jgi:hypothetical protein
MNARHPLPDLAPVGSLQAAEGLRGELTRLGIPSDVHDGYGLALVSVWVGLVVWCDQSRFWWRTGWDATRRRPVYAWHPIQEPGRAARRVVFRYAELRKMRPEEIATPEAAP